MLLKRLLLLIAFLFIAIALFTQNKYVTGSKLNFRNSPEIAQNNIIGIIQYGQAVKEIEKIDSIWSKIIYNNKTGYVASKFLSDHRPKTVKRLEEQLVLICESRNAYAYHKYRCRGLNRCTHTISKVSLTSAKSSGYRACKFCY